MKSIALKLGLSADADETAILTEVTRLLERVESAERELEPAQNRNTSLAAENQALLGEQVEVLLDAHQVREEKIRNRLRPLLASLRNREERVGALLDFGFKPAAADRSAGRPTARVLNRAGLRPPGEPATADDQSLADRAQAAIGEYRTRNRCSYGEARNVVRFQKPELFGLSRS